MSNYIPYSDHGTGLVDVHPSDNTYLDASRIIKWRAECLQHPRENATGNMRDHPTKPLPKNFKLIDVGRLCIVEPTDIPSYVAFCYVWQAAPYTQFASLESTTLQQLQAVRSVSEGDMPKMLWDAILLCQDLGERLLCVDRLGIQQDDQDAKLQQINARDDIYHNASTTLIVAADSARDYGLPGVRRKAAQKSLPKSGETT